MTHNIRSFINFASFLIIGAFCCQVASAVPVTHTPASGSNPAPSSIPFVLVAPGNEAGSRYIDFGVDYTSAAAVAVFLDPPLAFGGVNGSGVIDLLEPVNGRIVLLGTTTQGLTDSITVTAGNVDGSGDLLLEVFDINQFLIGSALNPTGGTDTWGLSLASPDIAYFRVSTPTGNSFGVNSVTIATPVGVPEPTTLLLAAVLAMFALPLRTQRA